MWKAMLVSEALPVGLQVSTPQAFRCSKGGKVSRMPRGRYRTGSGTRIHQEASREGRMVGKTVLVTGAGGFIGSHLVERLVRDGHRVRVLVRYNGRDDRGHLEDLPANIQSALEVTRGDLKDP